MASLYCWQRVLTAQLRDGSNAMCRRFHARTRSTLASITGAGGSASSPRHTAPTHSAPMAALGMCRKPWLKPPKASVRGESAGWTTWR